MAIGNPITLTNNVASKIISVTATAGQTAFTVTGGYRINQLAVFRNGVQLSQSSDFTANDGSTVTLNNAANVGDTVLFEVFDTFRVADALQANAAAQTINGDLTVSGTIVGLTSVTGSTIGIQSAGTAVGTAKTLNFVGTGNTFKVDGETIDISISGSSGASGGGLGTAITYEDETPSPFSYIDTYAYVSENLMLNATNAGLNTSIIVSVSPNIEVNAGAAVTVGAGKTMIIDVLQIGDL